MSLSSFRPVFVPIDAGAKDGTFHLLRDGQRHQYCARWNGKAFVYSSGQAVDGDLCDYSVRSGSLA